MAAEPNRLPGDKLSPLQRASHWLAQYQPDLRVTEQGRVLSIGDGIAWVSGLPSAAIEDMVQFEDGSLGLIYHLGADRAGIILLEESPTLAAGSLARLTGQAMSIGVGDSLLGRVIDPLGVPLDGDDTPRCDKRHPMDKSSPGITERDFVHQPLFTGNKIIDTHVPGGRGQRQLLIGDEGLGRSSLALDAVIAQRGRDVRCVYVMIGQRRSAVASTLEALRQHNAMDYTTLVVSDASALPGLTYLAPFAGCAIAEAWMQEGHHVLVVYDDLSTHARAYRELSLLLRRPPGREAYPGDIFFLHARLLERATCLNADNGGGSMTALPIVGTQLGEIAAYIPTNLISITDGQIYLSQTLFQSGFHPAIDISRSVSRIGGKAQPAAIKREASHTKLDFLQFLELENFTRFGARMEGSQQHKLERGRQLRDLLRQDRLQPEDERFNLAWLTAFNEGLFDNIDSQALPQLLGTIRTALADSALQLSSPRTDWIAQLQHWIDSAHDPRGVS